MDFEEGYLEGKLLVAMPEMKGSCFEESVIYVCSHNEEGAMGVIINRILENINPREVFKQFVGRRKGYQG